MRKVHKQLYLYFKLVAYRGGAFYSFEALCEKYLTLYYHFNCSLCSITIRSNPYFKKCSERPANCCGLWWHAKISRNIQAMLTHRPWVVTRWCTSPTDWIFSVNCRVTPSCLELFRFPFRSEAFSTSWLSPCHFKEFPSKSDWFIYFLRMGKIPELLLWTLVCIFPAL